MWMDVHISIWLVVLVIWMGGRFPRGAFQDQVFLFLGDEWLKRAKKIILSQLWRLEVQNQSVGGIGVWCCR